MLSSLALAFSVLLSAHPAPAQDAADLERLLRERVEAAASLSVTEIFDQAGALVEAGKGLHAAALDKLIDDRLQKADTLSEQARILLIGARLRGGEFDRAALSARISDLLDSRDEDIARAAATLVQDRGFHELKDKALESLISKLTSAAQDASRGPHFRLECAIALHVQGRGEGQRVARKEMMDFLASSDAKLRSLAALSLARVGDVETGRAELERISATPGADGRLAEAYLKQEDIRRLYDRKQKNLLKSQDEELKKQLEETGTDKIKTGADLKSLERVIKTIEKYSLEGDKVKREDLVNSALDGMLRSLDEHSSYLTPKSFEKFDQDLLQAEYGGIGAYVSEDPDDHVFTITRPIYSGPAYKAGLHSDDKIVRIDEWPTLGPDGSKPTDEIIKRLKGKPGTSVKLYIWRRGMDPALVDRPTEDMAVVVTREQIQIPPVQGQLLPGDIALVELSTFSRVASEALAEKISEFKKKGMRGVILDLRNNSGGLLTEARNVANLFLPKGKLVVTTESRTEEPERLKTQVDPLVPEDMPVAVLINRFSASASEIVSGALQDYQRATLVGQRSFGKGSVQQLLPVPGEPDDLYEDENKNQRHDSWEKLTKDWNGNGEFDFGPRVRLTIARYLLPSGRSIHRELDDKGDVISEGGVEPDDAVPPRRFEAWKIEEMQRLQKDPRPIRQWVEKNYPANKEIFQGLADGDEDDTSRYPGFDAFYNSLGTVLTPQDVRFLVRREVRRRVQDDRGAAFPDGDYEEDPQLQEAIRVVLEKLKSSYADIPAYARTFEPLEKDKKDKTAGRLLAGNMTDTARSNLRHLLDEARNSGGKLSAESLAELEKMLLDK